MRGTAINLDETHNQECMTVCANSHIVYNPLIKVNESSVKIV